MEVGAWTLYATIPPGCKGIVSHEDYGLIDIERDMGADIEALASYGVGRLVSMMSADDILSSGMGGLLTDLEGAGIEWTHLPFPNRRLLDDGFPRFLVEQAGLIRQDLEAGVKVAIHGAGWDLAFVRNSRRLQRSIEDMLPSESSHHFGEVTAAVGRLLLPM